MRISDWSSDVCSSDLDASPETLTGLIDEAAKLIENELAPLNASSDAQGCVYKDNTVKVPDGFPDFWKAYAEAGWIGIMQKPEYGGAGLPYTLRSAEHTSELQSLMRISYAVFCLKKKKNTTTTQTKTRISKAD